MKTIDDYLDKARMNHSISSYKKVGPLIGITENAVTQYRTGRAYPSDEVMKKLAKLADEDVHEALIHLNIWRAPESVKNTYANILQKISHAALVIMAIGAFSFNSSPAQAATSGKMNSAQMYIMENNVFCVK